MLNPATPEETFGTNEALRAGKAQWGTPRPAGTNLAGWVLIELPDTINAHSFAAMYEYVSNRFRPPVPKNEKTPGGAIPPEGGAEVRTSRKLE